MSYTVVKRGACTGFKDMLTLAAFVGGCDPNTEAEFDDRDEKVREILMRLHKKHLSDGDSRTDQKRFAIEAFETALALAKGEITL